MRRICRSLIAAVLKPSLSAKRGVFSESNEWRPLSFRPSLGCRLEMTSLSGNQTEFVGRGGVRYLVIRDGKTQRWFSRQGPRVTPMTKSGFEPCCLKMSRAWGRFIDLGKNGKNCRAVPQAVIFAKEVSPNQITQKQRTFEIRYCPFCGKRFEFLKSVSAK